MRKFSCLILLLWYINAHAQIAMPKVEVYATTGITKENFRWSIAGNLNGEKPNIYSELIWKNLSGPAIHAGLKMKIWRKLSYHFNLSNTFIKSGTVTDTDYGEDHRKMPTYSAALRSDQGKISFVKTGLGYQLFHNKTYTIEGFAGYTWNKQSLHLLPQESNQNPGIKTLNSTYKTNWEGVYIGADGTAKINTSFSVSLNTSYEQLSYHATADWNLIDAFAHPKSFIHYARGYGLSNKLQLAFKLNPYLSFHLQGTHYYALTASGTDELFLLDGGSFLTRMNGAKRNNIGLNAGISIFIP